MDAVVFGHSHTPLHEARRVPDLQPGLADRAPSRARHTMGTARVEAGQVRFELVELG
jgi:predicted phosphodiesterase